MRGTAAPFRRTAKRSSESAASTISQQTLRSCARQFSDDPSDHSYPVNALRKNSPRPPAKTVKIPYNSEPKRIPSCRQRRRDLS
ncbi:hypothetical protein NEISICOT_03066 [Neisseria sicca ATCC 29256]|uniref:Uncharacterized protein n=1 Tax=Neisseria sicca ATCC 29256 TaxID=547045 RepID=C6M941_NEISI|nr:hypothetical protein NEISICOT_03066 [Neisseria sicca ATCC 29256]